MVHPVIYQIEHCHVNAVQFIFLTEFIISAKCHQTPISQSNLIISMNDSKVPGY